VLSYPAVWQTFHAPCSARSTGFVWPILAISLVACDYVTPSPPNVPTPTLPTVTTVTITGLPTTFTVGETAQLTASATLPDGTRLNATGQVTWQSSAISVVTVSATGLLTVVASGEADVTATLQTVRGVVHVVVAKPSPLVPTYDITGVVHESAPTEDVVLAGATVGIHFAG
jgi:Big-like domain-containing protein